MSVFYFVFPVRYVYSELSEDIHACTEPRKRGVSQPLPNKDICGQTGGSISFIS